MEQRQTPEARKRRRPLHRRIPLHLPLPLSSRRQGRQQRRSGRLETQPAPWRDGRSRGRRPSRRLRREESTRRARSPRTLQLDNLPQGWDRHSLLNQHPHRVPRNQARQQNLSKVFRNGLGQCAPDPQIADIHMRSSFLLGKSQNRRWVYES